jgi:TRAP-type C4-dicarboxylate transport system permease small subunit
MRQRYFVNLAIEPGWVPLVSLLVRGMAQPVRLLCLASFLLLHGHGAWAAFDLNMTQGVTTTSHQVFDLHMLIFWICLAIAVVVFAVMAYSFVRHRRSRRSADVPAYLHLLYAFPRRSVGTR